MKDIGQKVKEIEQWMQKEIKAAKAGGAVIGLSGGIDSAVVSALCSRALKDKALGVIMPCHSNPTDARHAELVAQKFNLSYILVKLDDTYNAFLKNITDTLESSLEKANLAAANIKPRLRMATLYYLATQYNYLVMGTGNRSEIVIGYFTKYGDGGVDLEPIGHLLKSEVIELARYFEVPEEIISKPPTAGLWDNQTDEKEMGFTYQELDHYIKTGEARPQIKEQIEKLIIKSEHKRHLPPTPNS